ncbi:sigma factor [Microtetraspora fusca]|uniref:sigma factor n=1 Tax=Microtetraspora fusca TaxID=1997 RepID=UPI0008302A8F|nr:sigma factor [Microtetraspora fusca]
MDDTTAIRLTRGEPGALGECHRVYPAMGCSYPRRPAPAQDVEDVARVGFAEAWRSRRRFDPDRSLPTWPVGIAHGHEHARRDRVAA